MRTCWPGFGLLLAAALLAGCGGRGAAPPEPPDVITPIPDPGAEPPPGADPEPARQPDPDPEPAPSRDVEPPPPREAAAPAPHLPFPDGAAPARPR